MNNFKIMYPKFINESNLSFKNLMDKIYTRFASSIYYILQI